MKWWTDLLPIQGKPAADDLPGPHAKAFPADGPDPEREDRVMLLRHRLSHILYNRKFFTYPVTFNMETLLNLGLFRSAYAGAGWMYANMFKRAETSLEDFYINRFGTPLYNMFFKHYTEKVWGLPPSKLDASWGRQRVNGISISTLLKNFTRQKAHPRNDIRQEGVEKSLISNFLYPKLGPGQLWEEAAREIIRKGGEIILGHRACRLNLQDGKVREITATTPEGGTRTFTGDYVMSSMPIKDLVAAFGEDVTPGRVRDTASALPYRDFITAGLLLRTPGLQAMPKIPDTWIYIQERDMHVGRIQIFNNWSPYLIHDRHNHLWMGLEYFCNEGDALWRLSDQDFITMAQQELRRTGISGGMADVEDATVIRERKAYPAYHGSYAELPEVTGWLDGIPNLFCIGRNGQHRYNNMDHSMLTAMEAVSNLRDGRTDKQNIWNVNTEQTYHESQTD